jgi:hypothetical protein
MTPTTRCRTPPSTSDWPTAAGSARNRVRQNASEITTTGSASGRASAGASARPRAAPTPSVSNRFPVASAVGTRTGSGAAPGCPDVTLASLGAPKPATAANVRACVESRS